VSRTHVLLTWQQLTLRHVCWRKCAALVVAGVTSGRRVGEGSAVGARQRAREEFARAIAHAVAVELHVAQRAPVTTCGNKNVLFNQCGFFKKQIESKGMNSTSHNFDFY
jgi:hypothetical protein